MDVGRYVAPPPVDPVHTDLVADEGVLVAASAVRMTLRNRLIIRALRDGEPYDESVAREIALAVLAALAVEKEEDAARLDREIETARVRPGRSQHQTDYRAGDVSQLGRRAAVSRTLARRLREVADNEASVAEIVEAARESAWGDIQGSLLARLDARPENVADSEKYRRDREIRMRQLVVIDLAELERAAAPEY
ncbi:hypothetical protein [Homoserinibacter sp. YIM 151385]|uniref:hypothetical protein n=1 Tax=Homoserinibacter sp. YIM 151385 TaxID=2985506 RepID=UPI0022F04547|nr:hypothetical protein [Homoserinibacter sp. YIM 151385]WBU38130.1 hypothetical protein OF852_00675 [Homoserinibacter sp. YIM 151385]